MKEIWKDIKGYEGYYQISNLGRVKSLERIVKKRHGNRVVRERILNLINSGTGYYHVMLSKNGVVTPYLVHRLVANAYIHNKEKKGDVNHIDCNKLNNNVNNLEWNTRTENVQHAIKNGLMDNKGEKNYRTKLKNEDVIHIRELYESGEYFQKEIANIYDISRQSISDIIVRRRWKHI